MKRNLKNVKKALLSLAFVFAVLFASGLGAKQVEAASPAFKVDSFTIAVGDELYMPYLVKSSAGIDFYTQEDLDESLSYSTPALWVNGNSASFGYNTIVGINPGTTTIYAVDANGNYDTMVLNVTDTPAFVLAGTTSVGLPAGQIGRTFKFVLGESNTYHFDISGTTYSEIIVYDQNSNILGHSKGSGNNTKLSVRLEANTHYFVSFATYNPDYSQLTAPNGAQTLNVTVTKNQKATGVSLHVNAYALKIDGDTFYMMEGDDFDLKVVFEGGANVEKENFDIVTSNSAIANVYSVNKTDGTAKVHCNAAGTVDVSVATTNMHTDSFKLVVLSPDQVISGDVNLDGEITKADIEMIYAVTKGMAEKTRVYYHADMNGDGELTDADIAALWEILGGLPFVDVTEADWFYNAVEYNYNEGIMTGMNSIQFGPYESLSRAQFALILYRMQDTPEVTIANPFKDIAGGEWYADAVLWAYDNGIVTGFGDSTFRPADLITREQMVAMMYRYANYLEEDTSVKADYDEFIDADSVSDYASEAMQWAVGNGILTGKKSDEGALLAPWGATARAEAAAIIQRYQTK